MRQCEACEGFVPEAVRACPNCGSGRKLRRLGRVLSVLGAGAVMITAAACYGAPAGCPPGSSCACTNTTLLDGGTVPNGMCLDCRTPLADGGLTANDPEFQVVCETGDGGTDGGP